MMFWLAVIAMVAVGIVDDWLIRRTVTHEVDGSESSGISTDRSRIERDLGVLSEFDKSKERILRALQAHYYFGGSGQSTGGYAEREVAKPEVEPKVA
jgi:hypothetical protein